MLKLGIQNYIIHFIIGLLVSIYVPVLIGIICKKTKYLSFSFYPIKIIKEIKEKKKLQESKI